MGGCAAEFLKEVVELLKDCHIIRLVRADSGSFEEMLSHLLESINWPYIHLLGIRRHQVEGRALVWIDTGILQ